MFVWTALNRLCGKASLKYNFHKQWQSFQMDTTFAGRRKVILANRDVTLWHSVLSLGLSLRQKTSASCLVIFSPLSATLLKWSLLFTFPVPAVVARCLSQWNQLYRNPRNVYLWSDRPLNVTDVLEMILNQFSKPSLTGSWHVTDENHNYFLYSLRRDMFLWWGGVRVTQSDCEGGIDKEHLFLLLKTSGVVVCKASPFIV